jgi:threonine/homoserine efflux transporter RhtA
MAANTKQATRSLDWTFRRVMAGAGLTLSALAITTVFLPKAVPLDTTEWLSLALFGLGLLAGAGCFYVDVVVHTIKPPITNSRPLASLTFYFAVASLASAGVALLLDISHLVSSNGFVGLWVVLIPAALVVGLQLNINNLIVSAGRRSVSSRKPQAKAQSRSAPKRPRKARAPLKRASRPKRAAGAKAARRV